MNPLQDVFISYGRADSKQFAKTLNDRLVELGYTVWFDFEDIPFGVDYQKQIDDGIEKADNFLFVIAPHATNSAYCRLEVELALKRKKRIFPLLHVEKIDQATWQQRHPDGTAEQWVEYQAQGLHSCHTNMHPEIGKINWVQFKEGIDDFDQSVQQLVGLLESERDYVHQHTVLLNQALEWERNQKQTRYLLTGEERQRAEEWLAVRFADKQAPVWPTDLHYEYITESIKNATNLMTQVFLAHAEEDDGIAEKVGRSLMRAGITTWSYRADIEYGSDFEKAIALGIEQADNVLFLMSSHSLKSAYCQQELDLALKLNKRLLIMLAEQVDQADIPVFLRNRQYIDLTDNLTEADYLKDEDDLLRLVKQDATYYNEHKVLLTKALKWERQQRNPCILLQGYELQHAIAWREVAKTKEENGPTPLQDEFIEASQRQPAVTPDVFISYSRADSDFARRLNTALQRQRKRTWFDQESIASGTDFQQEIYKGIENSNFFLFVLSPRSVKSPYCADEVEYAAKLNKRMVTVRHRRVDKTDLHPELAKVQWIDFMAHDGEFDPNFQELLRTLDADPAHLKYHTQLLVKAIAWDEKGRRDDVLLRGEELAEAERWMLGAAGKQPSPTALQGEYVTASRELEERNQQRAAKRQRLVIGGLASLLVLAVAAGVVALTQLRRANQAIKVSELNQARSSGLYSSTLLNQGKEMEAWIEAIRAGTILEKYGITQLEGLNALQQAVLRSNQVRSFTGHDGWVWSVSFSPDGKTFVSGSQDKTIKLWDVETGAVIRSFTGHDEAVSSVSFSPDGKTLVSGSGDGAIKLWEVETGAEIHTFTGHDGWVSSVSFSPDGKTLVSGSGDGTIKLWEVETGAEIHTFTGHDGWVNSVSFSPDGKTLVSGSGDGTIKLWEVETGAVIRSFTGHDYGVSSVSFSPDGKTLVSGSYDKTIKLWEMETGAAIRSFTGHDYGVTSVSFSPDGKTLVSGSGDKTIKLWKVETGAEIRSFTGHDDGVSSVSFSPDGKTLVSGGYDETVKLWKVETGAVIRSFIGHDYGVSSVSFSPDGKTLGSGSDDGTIKLWKVETGAEIRSFTGHDGAVWSVSFSPDGKTLGSGGYDKTIKLWKVETGAEIRSFTGHDEAVSSVSFSPDGKTLVSGSDDGTIKLWKVKTGAEIRSFTGHDEAVWSVRFSPDGKILVSGSDDKTIKLWEVETGEEIHSFTGHDDGVSSVSFSPDGKTLVSGSDDKTIKLWEVETKAEIRSFTDHDEWVTSVSFSPDGKTLVSGSGDQTIKLWDLEALSLEAMMARGCDWLAYHVDNNPVEEQAKEEVRELCGE